MQPERRHQHPPHPPSTPQPVHSRVDGSRTGECNPCNVSDGMTRDASKHQVCIRHGESPWTCKMQPRAASAAKNENRLSQNGTIIQNLSHLLYNTEDSICQAQFTSLYLHQVFQSRIPTDPLTCPDTMSDSTRNFVLSVSNKYEKVLNLPNDRSGGAY